MDNKLNNIPENDTASSDSNSLRESFFTRYKRPLIGGAALLAVAAVSFKAGQYSMTPAFNDLVTAADNASAKAVNESGLEELIPAGESPATDQASDKNAGPDKATAVDKPEPRADAPSPKTDALKPEAGPKALNGSEAGGGPKANPILRISPIQNRRLKMSSPSLQINPGLWIPKEPLQLINEAQAPPL